MDNSFRQHQHQQHPPPPPPPPPFFPPPPPPPWYPNQFQYHPPPPQQWAPPPPPGGPYIPPSNPYPPPPSYHHAHFPHPHPHPQEWNTPPPTWHYPARTNEEDWAAKARAWADAKAAMESQHQHQHQHQHPQSQFSPAGRSQEQTQYHDQYQQHVDPRYPDVHNQPHPSSTYPQFPSADASMQRLPGHQEEHVPVSSEAFHASDGHFSYNARDGTATGAPAIAYQHHESLPTNPSIHQQEVPSSYSSVTGNGTADQHHVQLPMQAPFASGSHSVDPAISLADQPLDFAPRFNGHHDSATVSVVPPMNSWIPSVAPGVGYPPISPVLASGTQHDPSISTSPVPGHVAPPFGRFPGPGLPPPIPPGAAPFAINAGTTMLPASAFSGDAYGVPGVPERPKKASVPNWLRDEIKKAVIAPPVEYPKEESKFMNDVLTKVHELFDEIALKVSREDDLTSEVVSNQKASASPPSIPVHKTAAKVLVPVKVKEPEHDADSEKSNSSSAVDVLGLGYYASDADDEDGGMDGSRT